jgi:hypothetical protein
MGGDRSAVAKLNAFFVRLNAGRDRPYDWAGNEPSLWTPWEYDYFGAPSRTQEVVRRIATTLYSDTPADEPGNDDLGAISSWYVWAAIGLFPVTPGTANLALASPLFPEVVLTLPDDHTLVLRAPRASASTPYIHSLTVAGARLSVPDSSCASGATSADRPRVEAWDRPWLPSSIISTGGTLTYRLSATADSSWGAAPADSPPSFTTGRLPAVGFSVPSGGLALHVGQPATIRLGVEEMGPGTAAVQWSTVGASGLTLSARNGAFTTGSGATSAVAGCSGAAAPTQTQTITVDAARAGKFTVVVQLQSAGMTLPPVVMDLVASN